MKRGNRPNFARELGDIDERSGIVRDERMRFHRATSLAFLTAIALLTSGPVARAEGPPAIAVFTDTDVRVTDIAGALLSSYDEPFQFFSLNGNVFAGSKHKASGKGEKIVAYDATTGEKLFQIDDAFGPVVTAGGNKIGFWPDRWAHRDPYATSVWMRMASGRERRIIQLTGPRATVPRDPFEGEAVPLGYSFDETGRTLAVAYGNDVDLFIYDVWVVDTKTREATRVTKGKVSRFPSVAPSGNEVAVVREIDHCGGPDPGYRASKIQVIARDGSEKRAVVDGSCDLYYTDPRWISDTEIVAARLTRTAPGEYSVDLVKVDAVTGTVTELVTGGDVSYFTVSPSLQQIAFHRRGDEGGFSVYDIAAGTIDELPTSGYIPHLAGENRLI